MRKFGSAVSFLMALGLGLFLSGCQRELPVPALTGGPTPHLGPVWPRKAPPAPLGAGHLPHLGPATPTRAAAPAPPPRPRPEQLAIWTFAGSPGFSSGAPIAPTAASSGAPTLTMLDAEIDENGKDGQPYTDFKGVVHPADRAGAWNDIKKNDAPDAELVLKLDTTGWSGLALRFDYKSESAAGYNLDYSLDGGASWTALLVQAGLVADYTWQTARVDLSNWAGLENRNSLWLRINHLEDTGNDKFAFDNVEITGLFSPAPAKPITVAGPTPTAPPPPAQAGEFMHTGMSDASSAIAVDGGVMLVANDELIDKRELIFLFARSQAGAPLAVFDFTEQLDLSGRETDLEASTQVSNTIYWLSSLGNNKDGECRSDRQRLFATTIAGSGAATTLSYGGRYDFLRDDLIAWDRQNLHGLGADYFGFAASAYCAPTGGVAPKRPDGFNVEGLTMAPDDTTGFIAFRAPLAPAGDRNRALIVPVTNLAALPAGDGGGEPSRAMFGAPILLNLGGRGIRSIERNGAGEYLLIGGAVDNVDDFRLYSWTGRDPKVTGDAADEPVELVDLTALGGPGSWEGIVEAPAPLAGKVQIVLDNGTTDWYGDGRESKTLPAEQQRFRSVWVALD